MSIDYVFSYALIRCFGGYASSIIVVVVSGSGGYRG